MTLLQMEDAVAFAQAQERLLRSKAPELRRKHLRECFLKADTQKGTERAKGINAKMERNGQQKMWFFVILSRKDPCSDAAHIVHRTQSEDAVIEDSTYKEDTENFIFEENEYCFQLANDAL